MSSHHPAATESPFSGTDLKNLLVIPFSRLSLQDVGIVGGKNASLGELLKNLSAKGINVPDGFAVTANAYWKYLDENKLREPISQLLQKLDRQNYTNLNETGEAARNLLLHAELPKIIKEEILKAYHKLEEKYIAKEIEVAVRSSATAEDLPTASFAGQHESYLNIKGEKALMEAVKKCFASIFTDRAIKYREEKGFEHMQVALSVGVQKMVRADLACAGVGFSIDPETGFDKVIYLTGAWGLGENVVQGAVNPDEFYIFKPSLKAGKKAIISKKLGGKEKTMVYTAPDDNEYINKGLPVTNTDTPQEKREQYILSDEEITKVADWTVAIEQHYRQAMDIEWAKDGQTNELYIIQARPETVHGKQKVFTIQEYTLKEKDGKILTTGNAVGNKITSGRARILNSPKEAGKLQPGDVLVTGITNPDWDPILKKVSAIITEKGGRTSHASIIARELGVTAVVGTGNATAVIKDGQMVTVSCAEGKTGKIYDGELHWETKEIDFSKIKMPGKVKPMLIWGDPENAFRFSFYPNNGIGLMRLEFIINNSINIHSMALVKFDELTDEKAKAEIEKLTKNYADKKEYFIDKLSQAVATIAAAFYPKDVIVRMSDFKSNEYANLVGGKEFEPEEENPMLGFRGASRYYHEKYKEGFKLECEAMRVVRDEMGLTNVKLMIPFCRTVEEGRKVVAIMEENGLKRGENGLQIYVMVEIPSNVILAEKFAQIFDGFSIGSNDLTQLTLGIDRDSGLVSELFDENNEAAKNMIAMVIEKAKKTGTPIGLCGQAPSDFPEFAQFLVKQGINSISFNPDALIKGIENINKAEENLGSDQ